MIKYKWFAILISIGVIILSSAPIIWFSFHPKDNLVFLGRRYTNSQDTYTYVSFIEQARQGRILFENLYTTEPQKPTLFRPSYLLIGKFAALTNLSSINAYHISRIIFCIFFFFALWKFLGHFFKDEKSKFIAYCLILTSSGLGFLLFHFFPDSTDLWIPEGNTFLAFSEAPHFILSQALMIAGFGSFLVYLKSRKISAIFISSLFFLLLSFEHPFNLIVIAPVLFVTALWSGISIATATLIAMGSSVGLAYQYYQTLINPVLATWQTQNILKSPPPVNFMIGYGLILILAIIAIEKLLKGKLSHSGKFIITWVIVTALLLYIPFGFQRRLIEGVHIPLSILATFGLLSFVEKYKETTRRLLMISTLIILSGTSIFMTYTDFNILSQDKSDNYYYHITSAEMSAIKWLGPRTTSKDTILSNWYIGNLIPGLIGRKVYLGHKIQTADWGGKNVALDEFVRNNNISISQKFLSDNHISYIFIAKNDILTKNGFKAENYPNLKNIYDHNGVSVYRVK